MTLTCCSMRNTKWYYMNAEKLPNRFPFSYESTVRLFNVRWKDAGFYFCYGAHAYVSKSHFLSIAVLQIFGRFLGLSNLFYVVLYSFMPLIKTVEECRRNSHHRI